MKTLLKGFIFLATGLVVIVVGCSIFTFRHGRAMLGPLGTPSVSGSEFPQDILELAWLELGSRPPIPERIGAVVLLRALREQLSAGMLSSDARTSLPYSVSRAIRWQNEKNVEMTVTWHFDMFSSSLWLAGNWRTDQLLVFYLRTAPMGHGVHGIEVAADTFFQTDVTSLSRLQAAALISLSISPQRHSLWCNPQENARVTSRWLARGEDPAARETDILREIRATVSPVPTDQCPDRPAAR